MGVPGERVAQQDGVGSVWREGAVRFVGDRHVEVPAQLEILAANVKELSIPRVVSLAPRAGGWQQATSTRRAVAGVCVRYRRGIGYHRRWVANEVCGRKARGIDGRHRLLLGCLARCGEAGFNVRQDVRDVFDANRKPNKTGRYAGGLQLLVV